MTPPPETPAAGETLERIAKRIVRKHVCGCHECKTDRAALETDILSALCSARDRAVRIIDDAARTAAMKHPTFTTSMRTTLINRKESHSDAE